MCKLNKPEQDLCGVSIAKDLANPDQTKDRDVFHPYMTPNTYAVMNKNWRYILYDDGGEELYDVKKDPNEWTNLIYKGKPPEQQKVIDKLKMAAPKEFAPQEYKFNIHKELVIEGDTFRWEKKNHSPPANKGGNKKKKKNKK